MSEDRDKAAMLMAWENRRERYSFRDEIDNASLPAGSPMWFRCPACFGPIIVPEDYLTRPTLCYDCRDLADRDWIVEMPPAGTGWNRRPDV